MTTAIDKSGSFVASQFTHRSGPIPSRAAGPAVTISHQTGAGAHAVAEQLAVLLQRTATDDPRRWTVLDRALVETALEEHHWPRQLAERMPEDKRSYVDDVLDDLFGLRPPSWVLVPQVAETILHLAETGHVVLIGRGATIVTARLPNVFHVRLVASLATRVKRTQGTHGLSPRQAARFVENEDRGRHRYVRANFHTRLEDELLYHLVVNTDRVPIDDAAILIADAAQRYFRRRTTTNPLQ